MTKTSGISRWYFGKPSRSQVWAIASASRLFVHFVDFFGANLPRSWVLKGNIPDIRNFSLGTVMQAHTFSFGTLLAHAHSVQVQLGPNLKARSALRAKRAFWALL
ncbi:MAG: hypothetical protein MIO92_09135, partial [Methanosarcinaceae archaeon]|nr:hypothetical protein [Methanosarcinaceae archaeon]